MKLVAEIVLEFENEAVARAVFSSLAPDNLSAPPTMRIAMAIEGRNLRLTIEEESIAKLSVAINDVLLSAYLAEAVVRTSARGNRLN